MRTRRLGNTDLNLSTVGLGTWAMGGGEWAFGWGPQDEAESISALHGALDAGINWIDTAPIYGLGVSEEVVGRALAGMSERPIVATKCARCWTEDRRIVKRLKVDSVKAECEDSLRRLGVQVIDLYQIHWPEPDEDVEEGWRAVEELRQEGKIRWGGVSNFSVSQMQRAHEIAPVSSLQPPYSMIRRDVEEGTLSWCGENGVGIVAYSPMGKGLLTGRWDARRAADLPTTDHRRRDPKFTGAALDAAIALAAVLQSVGRDIDATPAQVAIAWVLRRAEVTSAIVGGRRADQIAETAAAGDLELNEDALGRITAAISAYDGIV